MTLLGILAAAAPTPADGHVTYLALGDSYTIGEGVERAGRWPVQLAATLRAEGIALDDPRTIATTGWTTDELSAAIDAAGPLGTFGFVSLAIGVNNQYRGRAAEEYRGEFTRLLERAIDLAGGHADRVLVLGIPDWGATPFAAVHAPGGPEHHQPRNVSLQLDAYNAIAAEACAARRVAFVDVAAASRARGGEMEMLADDGLHPSALMYRQWMQLALPVVRQALSR